MDRYWFLTWHTYGTWLPGDERGFVDPVVDEQGDRVIHNLPGTPVDADNARLRQYSRDMMKGEPVYLIVQQAAPLLEQFRETARYRGWEILAASIMPSHVHLVVGVPGDPDPAGLLRDFKSYGSRCLNERWGARPKSWWTESGSQRPLKTEAGVNGAVDYVLHRQPNPLLTWPGGERPA